MENFSDSPSVSRTSLTLTSVRMWSGSTRTTRRRRWSEGNFTRPNRSLVERLSRVMYICPVSVSSTKTWTSSEPRPLTGQRMLFVSSVSVRVLWMVSSPEAAATGKNELLWKTVLISAVSPLRRPAGTMSSAESPFREKTLNRTEASGRKMPARSRMSVNTLLTYSSSSTSASRMTASRMRFRLMVFPPVLSNLLSLTV